MKKMKKYLEGKLEGVKGGIERAAKMYVLVKVMYDPGHHMLEDHLRGKRGVYVMKK